MNEHPRTDWSLSSIHPFTRRGRTLDWEGAPQGARTKGARLSTQGSSFATIFKLQGRALSRASRTQSDLQHNLTSPGRQTAGAMAMALQSQALHVDSLSLSNGFLGMGLTSPRPGPASQVTPSTPLPFYILL